ncbi:MAG TPA: hypothetical protein VF755_15825 [Catenuloplanes sp.]
MPGRKPLPIGPLGIALRHLHDESGGRRAAWLAAVFGLAVLVGVGLVLLR